MLLRLIAEGCPKFSDSYRRQGGYSVRGAKIRYKVRSSLTR